jgi:D-serine deaminase-like pyridoxal phosphate-dependent protein
VGELALADLPTPALLIRLDRVRANLAELLRRAGGPGRLRPHLKTTKIPAVWQLLLDGGLDAFKCATVKEAEVLLGLAEANGRSVDLLVAFPHRGANLALLAALAARHPAQRLALLADDPDHAGAAAAGGLGVFIDLDLGGRRTGIPIDQEERVRRTATAAGSALRGWHAYEGEVRDAEPAARAERCGRRYRALAALLDRLEGAIDGAEQLELVTSGTPAFDLALAAPELRKRRLRVSPGTVLFHDTTSAAFGLRGFVPAATVLTRVVSAPATGHLTLDAGSKAVDAACGDPVGEVLGHPGLLARTPSEEHLPLRVEAGEAPPLGSLLELVPRHVCPTVNLYDEAVLLEGERILGPTPVAARGHEGAGWRAVLRRAGGRR